MFYAHADPGSNMYVDCVTQFDVHRQGSSDGIVNAFGYGNILCLVNDPSQVEPYEAGEGNVEIYPVLINNFLFGIMATTKNIDKGKPLPLSLSMDALFRPSWAHMASISIICHQHFQPCRLHAHIMNEGVPRGRDVESSSNIKASWRTHHRWMGSTNSCGSLGYLCFPR